MDNYKNKKKIYNFNVEKLINEYDVGEMCKTPWSKFKIRIYQRENGVFRGCTNLLFKSNDKWLIGEGFGNNEIDALEYTLKDFMEKLDSFDEELYNGEFDENMYYKELPSEEF